MEMSYHSCIFWGYSYSSNVLHASKQPLWTRAGWTCCQSVSGCECSLGTAMFLRTHTYHSCQGVDAVLSLPRYRLVGRSVVGLAVWLSALKPDWTPHVRCPWHFWLLASATSELRMPLVSFLPNCFLECFQLWFPSIHLLSFFWGFLVVSGLWRIFLILLIPFL